ncbi:hypothetical protein [Bradyrhizobium sp.]|uniref:hypothetical protein n=1 Tax=Bradyrhizobium sp. TaxID=376 RepID=UPI003C6BAD2E
MKRSIWAVATAATIVSLLSIPIVRAASPQEEKGKVCRMEQQCHWENFKKICVYVKVCR